MACIYNHPYYFIPQNLSWWKSLAHQVIFQNDNSILTSFVFFSFFRNIISILIKNECMKLSLQVNKGSYLKITWLIVSEGVSFFVAINYWKAELYWYMIRFADKLIAGQASWKDPRGALFIFFLLRIWMYYLKGTVVWQEHSA